MYTRYVPRVQALGARSQAGVVAVAVAVGVPCLGKWPAFGSIALAGWRAAAVDCSTAYGAVPTTTVVALPSVRTSARREPSACWSLSQVLPLTTTVPSGSPVARISFRYGFGSVP